MKKITLTIIPFLLSSCSIFNNEKIQYSKTITFEGDKVTLGFNELIDIEEVTFYWNPITVYIHKQSVVVLPIFNRKTHIFTPVIEKSNATESDKELVLSFVYKYALITAENADEILTDIQNIKYYKKPSIHPESVQFYKTDEEYCPENYYFTYYPDKRNGYMTLKRIEIRPSVGTKLDPTNYINFHSSSW